MVHGKLMQLQLCSSNEMTDKLLRKQSLFCSFNFTHYLADLLCSLLYTSHWFYSGQQILSKPQRFRQTNNKLKLFQRIPNKFLLPTEQNLSLVHWMLSKWYYVEIYLSIELKLHLITTKTTF